MADKLTDERRRGFFIIDNEVIDNHIKDIGIYGLAVYSLLVRMAGSKDDSFPSYKTMADKLGISKRQAIDSVQKLVDAGLVSKALRMDTMGDRTSNQYKICDVKVGGSAGYAPQVVQDMHQGSAGYAPYQDTVNKTHSKKTVLSAKALPQPELLQQQPEKQPTATESVTEKETPTPSAAAPLPLVTEQQRKFQLLCNIVGWDAKLLTKEQQGQVAQTLGILCKAGYTEEHLAKFHDQVWAKDWRWQQHHSYPSLAQVRAEMGKLKLQQQVAATRTAAVEQQQTAIPQMLRMQQRKGFYTQ